MEKFEGPTASGRRHRGTRRGLLATAVGLAVVATALLMTVGASAVTGAISTTDNPGFGDSGGYTDQACLNGQGVNCNIYLDKRDVWVSGLPVSAALGPGTYYFAVLVPGGQPDPNDDGAKNLSDTFCSPYSGCPGPTNLDSSPIPSGDDWTNREFTVDGSGDITSYSGTHNRVGNLLQLFPYDDTTNNGGVYILAVCKVPSNAGSTTGAGTPGVAAHDCKYDAFKVRLAAGPPTGKATDLDVTKGANPTFTREFNWSISKGVDACQVTLLNPNGCSITGSTKTLNYTVTVTKDNGTDRGWDVSGTITVTNPNAQDASGVQVSDQITYFDGTNDIADPQATCTVSDGDGGTVDHTNATIPGSGAVDFPYDCTYSGAPASSVETNTASATWSGQCLTGDDPCTLYLDPGTPTWPVPFTWSTPTTVIHDSVNVSDLIATTNPATLPTGFAIGNPVGDSVSGSINQTTTYHYSRTLTVPHDCLRVDNNASFSVTDPDDVSPDTDDSGNSSVAVKVCRTPARTGALTMGFWQNKNGQGIVAGYSGTYCLALKSWLLQFNPFNESTLSSQTSCGTSPSLARNATPSGVVGYVYNVIKAATCSSSSNTCNSMLKAQMLATALNVYFSASSISLTGTVYASGVLSITTLGGNRIGAFDGLNGSQPSIGTIAIDLTNICTMIDKPDGTATCSGAYKDASGVFGGNSSLKVIDMLAYMNTDGSANGNGNPVSNLGGSSWYLQIKSKQVCAKDAFDAINNRVAFGA